MERTATSATRRALALLLAVLASPGCEGDTVLSPKRLEFRAGTDLTLKSDQKVTIKARGDVVIKGKKILQN